MKKSLLAMLLLFSGTAMAQVLNESKLVELQKEKDPAVLEQKLKKLSKGSEKDLEVLIQYYGKDPNKSDSLRQVAIKRFPKGLFSFHSQWNLHHTLKPAVEQEAQLRRMKKTFVSKEFDFDFQNSSVAITYAKEKNTQKALEYFDPIKNQLLKITSAKNIANLLNRQDSAAVKLMLTKQLEKTRYLEPKSVYYSFSAIYGWTLMDNGQMAEALKYTEDAFRNLPEDTEISRDYNYLLSVNGRYQEAFPFMEKLVKSGFADEKMKEQLSKAYVKLNPGKDANIYMSSLTKELNDVMKEHLAKFLVEEPAPSFKVKDVNGNEVSLEDYKGKILVLDFWATWCGPCVASFPAMQRVVNKYNANPDVNFLFIHTLEKGEDPLEDAKSYLAKKDFRFDLLIDAKDPKTKVNPAYKAFGSHGIPYKVLIDKRGKVRFKTAGFKGGDDALVEELSAMIEMVK